MGQRGTLRGQEYQVSGALLRRDSTGRWTEYLLFDPSCGYRWLVYDTGHWSFGVPVEDVSQLEIDASVRYEGRTYRRFRSGTSHVEQVEGKFYWEVHKGNWAYYSDYIAPPFMLTRERSGKEEVWTHLEYIEPADIDAAFGCETPPRQWVSANQPNPAGMRLRRILPTLIGAHLAAVAIQIDTVVRAREVAFPEARYEFGAAEQVFGPYSFSAPHSLNELTASASLNNSWVELDCVLVNAGTGATFDFTDELSYYSGTDSDGAWSEGNGRNTAVLSGIPAGTYNLVVEGFGADQANQPLSQPVTLQLRHDVVPWANFWLTLLTILIYPVWLLYRQRAGEKERSESATA